MKQIQLFSVAIVAIGALSFAADAEAGDLGLFAVGGSANYAKPGSNGGAMGLSLQADIGEIAPGLALFPSISYWSTTKQPDGWDSYGASYKNQELGLQADVHYYVNPEANSNFYIGGGVGLYKSKQSIVSDDYSAIQYELQQKDSIGMSVLGGLEVPVGQKARFTTEARYKVDGNQNTFGVGAGFMFELGQK